MILKTHYGCHCQELRSLRTSRWPSMRWLITGLCVLWIADYSGSWFLTSSVIVHFPAIDLTLIPITTLPWRSLVYPLPGTTLKPVPGRKLESQSNMTSRDPDHHWVVWFYTWLPQELISVWVPMFTNMESLNVKVSKNILKISKRIYRIVTSWNV